jgi:hypothetical protein
LLQVGQDCQIPPASHRSQHHHEMPPVHRTPLWLPLVGNRPAHTLISAASSVVSRPFFLSVRLGAITKLVVCLAVSAPPLRSKWSCPTAAVPRISRFREVACRHSRLTPGHLLIRKTAQHNPFRYLVFELLRFT